MIFLRINEEHETWVRGDAITAIRRDGHGCTVVTVGGDEMQYLADQAPRDLIDRLIAAVSEAD